MSIVWIILVAIILFFSFLHLRESIKISKQNRDRRCRERQQQQERANSEEFLAQLKREGDERREREVRERQERERRKHEELKERERKEKALVNHFAQSDEVHKMVTYICGGKLSNRPSEIWVCSDHVATESPFPVEREKCYFFKEHRVAPLKAVCEEQDGFAEPREIIAMALAINSILENDYEVYESSIISCLHLKPNKSF